MFSLVFRCNYQVHCLWLLSDSEKWCCVQLAIHPVISSWTRQGCQRSVKDRKSCNVIMSAAPSVLNSGPIEFAVVEHTWTHISNSLSAMISWMKSHSRCCSGIPLQCDTWDESVKNIISCQFSVSGEHFLYNLNFFNFLFLFLSTSKILGVKD